MNRRISTILIVVLLLTTIIFACLWIYERNDNSAYLTMAQAGATDAYLGFTEYQMHGEESNYWAGVAAFRAFEQAYYQGTKITANHIFCNEVYGSLLIYPERSQGHIEEIIGVMKVLANDVEDENGFLLMADLRNNITE